MAKNGEASLIIKLKDEASAGLTKLGNSFNALRATILGVAAGVTGFIAVGMDALRAYAEQETAINKLEVALQNQGLAVEENSQRLQRLADELQKTTTFEDDAIIQTEAMLTTFGLAGDVLDETTRAALDLSKGLGVDLQSATMLLGKAAVGETGALSRYGIKISDTIPAAEKLTAVLDQVNQRFGGSAQAALGTVTGRLENFSNRVNDLKERLGAGLLPIFDFWLRQMDKAVSLVDQLTKSSIDEAKGRELTILALEREKNALIDNAAQRMGGVRANAVLSESEQHRLNLITQAIAMEKQRLTEEEAATAKRQETALGHQAFLDQLAMEEEEKEALKREREIASLDQQTATILARTQTRNQMLVALQTRFTQQQTALLMTYLSTTEQQELLNHVKRLEEHGKFNDAQLVMDQTLRAAQEQEEKALEEERKKRNEERVKNFESTLSFISSLSSAHNKGLAAIGKAAAISTATIDTYAAANKALASAPPPWNFALTAAVTAAGIANVARISGVQLAEGGVVMPRAGGTLATIGEAGKAEAVIPLDDERARQALGDNMGGRVNVTIQAGVVVADKYSMRELAQMIDKELFHLERNGMSVRV